MYILDNLLHFLSKQNYKKQSEIAGFFSLFFIVAVIILFCLLFNMDIRIYKQGILNKDINDMCIVYLEGIDLDLLKGIDVVEAKAINKDLDLRLNIVNINKIDKGINVACKIINAKIVKLSGKQQIKVNIVVFNKKLKDIIFSNLVQI